MMLNSQLRRPFLFVLLSMLGFIGTVCAQVELQKIAPKAPNTAALLRVSENNISHYTGAADINFPLYTVQSGALQLTLSLSYSSTGNKVEDIASWVGLGWNLGNIPVITRQVRGLRDEDNPGVSVPYMNGTIDLDSLLYIEDAPGHNLFWDVVCGIANRYIDVEPDMFHYTLLNGQSGNFYWDPYQQKFQTHPKRNVIIEKFGAGSIDSFEILDDNGIIYLFKDYETSQSSGFFNGPTERNAWYISKIYSPNRTDSISFGYNSQNIVTRTLNPHKQELVATCEDNSSVLATTTLLAKIPHSISFKEGYVQFEGDSSEREDLDGGYSLKGLKVYNFNGAVIKHIGFEYFYTNGSSTDPLCDLISILPHEKKRLFLSSMYHLSGNDTLRYSFEYNTTIVAPCRVSSAQDFWGYYNGELNNQNLVPEVPKGMFGLGTKTNGARRYINPNFNQFGILKRIIYPTGGRSDFFYETHQMLNNNLPGIYYDVSAYLTEEHLFSTDLFIDTISIVSDEDKYINNSATGGSFVDIIIGDQTCAGSNPPPNCAEFTVRGIDSWNSDVNFPVTGNIQGHLLKKGRYEVKASFSQGYVPNQGFFMLFKWRERDTSSIHRYAGGLRVKEIKQYDSLGNVYSKRFLYQKSVDNDTSSAVPLSSTNMIMLGLNECYADPNNLESGRADQFFIYSNSKATLGSYGGSHVAYNNVIEFYDSSAYGGFREFTFFDFGVHLNEEMPFIPPDDYSEFRAKPTRIAVYGREGGEFSLLSEELYSYDELFFTDIEFDAMKAYITLIPPAICDPGDPSFSGQHYIGGGYKLTPNLSLIRVKVSKIYDPINSSVLVKVDSFFYNTKHFALCRVVSNDSKGNLTEKLTYYSIDSASSGLDSDVWAAMINKNMVGIPTKVVTKVAGAVLETLVNKFDYESSADKVLLKNLYHSYGNAAPSDRVQFTFSSSDQVIEQRMKDDVKEVYLWGYGGRYPVAKILNSTHATALSYVNQTVLNNPTSDEALRTELENLFSIPNALVEFYTYRPGVGVSSITDTRGRTSYYNYDGHNRLSFVLDHDGKVLKKYCYNYAGQSEACTVYYSVADSASFTRNNCGTGYTGGSVTYVIPAGKYTSYASQADADQKAQNDVNTNGQAYANTQGTCTQSIYAKLTYENYNYSYSNAVHADVVVRFYSDASCTTPLSVSNLTIQLSTEGFDGNDIFSYDYPETVSGTYFVVEANAELSYDDGMAYRFKDYFLLSGTGYTVVW